MKSRTIIRHIKPYGVPLLVMRHPDGTYSAHLPMLHVQGHGEKLRTAVLEALMDLLELSDYALLLCSHIVPHGRWGNISADSTAMAMMAIGLDALAHYRKALQTNRSDIANQLSMLYLDQTARDYHA